MSLDGFMTALSDEGYTITLYSQGIPETEFEHSRFSNYRLRYFNAGTDEVYAMLEESSQSDIIIKVSACGNEDEIIEEAVLELQYEHRKVIFWDIEGDYIPSRFYKNPEDPLANLLKKYDWVLTSADAPLILKLFKELGVEFIRTIYPGINPKGAIHPHVTYKESMLLISEVSERAQDFDIFFLLPACQCIEKRFRIFGNSWDETPLPSCISTSLPESPREFRSDLVKAKMILILDSEFQDLKGTCPGADLFKAIELGACVIAPNRSGIDKFFVPGKEILIANNTNDVKNFISVLSDTDLSKIARAAHKKAVNMHSYKKRVAELEKIFNSEIKQNNKISI